MLEKELLITGITEQRVENAPWIYMLNNREDSHLSFDEKTIRKYGLWPSRDLGRTLIVGLALGKLEEYDPSTSILIDKIEKNEEQRWPAYAIEPKTFNKTEYSAHFTSAGRGDGMHFSVLPCPFYKLTLDINREEYYKLKKIQDLNFLIEFRIKD